jgi:hypothetical protein
VATGDKVGQLRQGMDDRLGCPANNWSSFPNLPPSDPRIIPLILTPYGSFSTSGGGLVPIIGFAAFYVTGWDGVAKCAANEAFPGSGSSKGDIWGHFVKGIAGINNGGGTTTCDISALGECVAVLTK